MAHDSILDVSQLAMQLRTARLEDLPTISSWISDQRELTRWIGPRFTFPLDPNDLPRQFDWSSGESWTLTIGDHVAAFGQLHTRPTRRQHLTRIITIPERRGHGIGTVLVKHLIKRSSDLGASVVSLNVRPDNEAAGRFYRRLGFTDAVRPDSDRPLPSTYLELRLNSP